MKSSFLARTLFGLLFVTGAWFSAVAEEPVPAPTAAADPATTAVVASGAGEARDAAPVAVALDEAFIPEHEGELLSSIRRSGELRVGVSVFMPWVMHDQGGALFGFEIDVARRLAEDLGVELKLVPTSWGDIIPDLLEGYYDIVVSGLSITPRRALQVEFSAPYNHSELLLLAHRTRAKGLHRLKAFNRTEIEIGVRRGTTAAAVAAEKLPRATLIEFDSDADLYAALREGRFHALVASYPTPVLEARRDPQTLVLALQGQSVTHPSGALSRRPDGFALRPGNQRLLNYLNAWIAYHRSAGFFARRRAYWFEGAEWRDRL